jgi:glycosyltransferase involved in cell wall biosynthesis
MDRERFQPLVIAALPGVYTDMMVETGYEVKILHSQVGSLINDILSCGRRNPLYFLRLYSHMRKDAKKLRKVLQENKVDILHTHHHHHHLLGGMACKGQLPNVWQVHAIVDRKSAYGLKWRALNFFASRPSRIIAVSSAVRDHMAKSVQGKTTVINDGIEVERFGKVASAEAKCALGFSPEARIVGMVGTFLPDKGLHDFISMAEIAAPKHKDVHFVLIGPSDKPEQTEYRNACLQQIERAGLKNRFTITGLLQDPASFMPSIDILVHPSWREGFGLGVLEAQACGIPVVATDCGGPADIIIDGKTGYIVPLRDINAMAEHVSKLLADRELAKQMGSAAKARANAPQFNIVNTVRQIENIYLSILGK